MDEKQFVYPVDSQCVCYEPPGHGGHKEPSGRIFDWTSGINQIPLPQPCTKHLSQYQNPMWIEVTNDLRKRA